MTKDKAFRVQKGLAVRLQSNIARLGFDWIRLGAVSGLLLISVASIGALIYFTLIASSSFVADTSFTVRATQPLTIELKADGSDRPPTALIAQDTQIIMHYLRSRSLVEQLDKDIDLRHFYTNSDVDYFSRLKSDAKIEEVIRYWESMTGVSAQLNGIVTLSVRAFSPEDAVRITQACIEASEKVVNQLNADMVSDNIAANEIERQRAAAKLDATRAELERVRNQESIIDPVQSQASLTELINGVRSKLLGLQQDYQVQSRYADENAPQIRALQARILAAKNEIERLTALQTSQKQDKNVPSVLSDSYSKVEAAALENRIAEKQYSAALSRLENARLGAAAKLMYVEVFLRPELPQQPKYPYRKLFGAFFGILTLASLAGAIAAFLLLKRA